MRTKKIDSFIKKKQRKFEYDGEIVFEWVPYNQFNVFKEISKSPTVYLAVWKDGPLRFDSKKKEYIKNENKNVALEFLHISQNNIDNYLKV